MAPPIVNFYDLTSVQSHAYFFGYLRTAQFSTHVQTYARHQEWHYIIIIPLNRGLVHDYAVIDFMQTTGGDI